MRRTRLDVLGPVRITGERLLGKIIDLGRGPEPDIIGDGAVLEDCELRILGEGRLVNLEGVTLRRCAIRAPRGVAELSLQGTRLLHCDLRGRYAACDFGRESGHATGAMARCDLHRATMHTCVFLEGCDRRSIRWPGWPHLLVTNLTAFQQDFPALELPRELQRVRNRLSQHVQAQTLWVIHFPSVPGITDPAQEVLPALEGDYLYRPHAPHRPARDQTTRRRS
jgi:hypothetical protein